MAGNSAPIFSRIGHVEWGAAAITAANTATDGTGTVTTVFTADATNGSFVQSLRFMAVGTNIQTLARVFVNNGSTSATVANNSFIADLTLPATSASNTQAQPLYELPINRALDPGYKINVVLATAVAAGYQVTVFGGHY